MHFNKTVSGKKMTRDRTLTKLVKSRGLMLSASGISNTKFLSSNPDELCNRLKLLIQGKQAGNNLVIIIEEMAAIIDKLLEYKSMTPTQHKKIIKKLNLI